MWWKSKPTLREQQIGELKARVERVRRAYDTTEAEQTVDTIVGIVYPYLKRPALAAFHELVSAEGVQMPDVDSLDMKGRTELAYMLRKWELRGESDGLLNELLETIFTRFCTGLPSSDDTSALSVPLAYAYKNLGEFISLIYRDLFEERYFARDLLRPLREQMYLNLCHHSGIDPTLPPKRDFQHAFKSDLPPDKLVSTYLRKTPLEGLFKVPVYLRMTRNDRMNHMHIIGGTGAGKTSLIKQLIQHDTFELEGAMPAMVVIEPHGDLVRTLAKLDGSLLQSRVVHIDPRDVEYPPALNVFALNRRRLATYDAATREQVIAGAIQTFEYLFSGLGVELTGKQQVLFRNACRVMLAMPESMGRNGTVLDMLRLMQEPERYREAIDALPDIPREFFERDFKEPTFKQTREQIRYRLQAIIENPTMGRLFTSEETKLDLFEELNSGGIILVDTAKDFLKDGSSPFGRLFISLVLQAVLERAALVPKERKDTFLIVDEAASYFDTNIDDLLTEARKYRCGLVLAHQYLDQATHALRASLAANAGIKLASGLSAQDARAMAPDMRTTADFILSRPQLEFACFIRGVTPQAVAVAIRPGIFADIEDTADALRERNREKVSAGAPQGYSAPPRTGRVENEDVSPEW